MRVDKPSMTERSIPWLPRIPLFVAALMGASIAVLIAVEVFVITRDPIVLPYAIGLGGMAGAAWASRFPRATVAAGALLFVASDMLIFAHETPSGGSIIPALLIWPL